MGWLFKTPGDDAVEGTLRALHNQNIVDREYQRVWGWAKVALAIGVTIVATSAFEFYNETSLWQDWLGRFKNWVSTKLGM